MYRDSDSIFYLSTAYTKQKASGKILIVVFTCLKVFIIKVAGRICIQRFWCRISHPGTCLCRQLLDKMFISSCHKYMPSRPLLISPIHRVNSSSRPVYLKVSSSHLVVSSSHLVVLLSHLVVSSFLTYCLVVPLLVYSSTRRITFQLVVLPFNSSCRLSTRRVAFQLVVQRSRALFLGPKGPGYHN